MGLEAPFREKLHQPQMGVRVTVIVVGVDVCSQNGPITGEKLGLQFELEVFHSLSYGQAMSALLEIAQ